MASEVVEQFYSILSDERLNGINHEDEIVILYDNIIENMSSSYEYYRNNVASFLSSLEINNPISLKYSIAKFQHLFEDLMSFKKTIPFDSSIINSEIDPMVNDKLKNILHEAFAKDKEGRLSKDNFDLSQLEIKELHSIGSLQINAIYQFIEKVQWDKDTLESALMCASILRPVLGKLNNMPLFYHTMGLISQKLSQFQYYQINRDIAEEVLLTSFNSNNTDWGFLFSYKVYSNNASIHASLLYGILSMTSCLKSNQPINEKYLKEIIEQSIQFFRNVGFYEIAEEIYESIPANIVFVNEERRYLQHSYLNTLLYQKDERLPNLYNDYINEHKEVILSGELNEALPCLTVLYYLKKFYPETNFEDTGFQYFVDMLEYIVPDEKKEILKAQVFSDSPLIKKYLLESIIKLEQTRSSTDFVYDNEYGLKLSTASIEYAVKTNDYTAFQMGMILKADFSLMFNQQILKSETAALEFRAIDLENIEKEYSNIDNLKEVIGSGSKDTVLYIAITGTVIQQMSYQDGEFKILQLPMFEYKKFKELSNSGYFSKLLFSDTIRDNFNVRSVFPEEHKSEGEQIKKELSFTAIDIDPNTTGLLIIKDMQLSKLPHNLLLDQKGNFIGNSIPITNILSTEWFLQSKHLQGINADYSKSIYIPIDSTDYPLNILYSKIEDTLTEYNFVTFTSTSIESSLNSEINIICSHGADNISETHIVYQNEKPIYDWDDVIGEGKILIFFICHSGSMTFEFYRNSVTSLVKKFLRKGYQAIIAPNWALEVSIPGIWLPEFMSSFNNGNSVAKAVFDANLVVYDRYPTPAAWGCLHLYGNPYLKLKI